MVFARGKCVQRSRIDVENISEERTASETSLNTYRTTCRYIPEDTNLNRHRCDNLKSNEYIGFQVLAAVAIKSSVFWDITPRGPLKVNRHLPGRIIRQARNQHRKQGASRAFQNVS
jgi:hypothetical protein